MMKLLLAGAASVMFSAACLAQSVPFGLITGGQKWTVPQWNAGWQSKADVTNGTLNNPTIANGTLIGTSSISTAIVGGTLGVGASSAWLSAILGHAPPSTTLSISSTGQGALLGATRTSDSTQAGSMSPQGVTAVVVNDNATQVQTAYGGYFETRRSAGAGTSHGIEIGMVNRGTTVASTPNATNSTGLTPGLWLSSGRFDVSDGTDASVAIGVISGPTRWGAGLVVGKDALVAGAYGAPAVYLGLNNAVMWQGGTGGTAGVIRSDTVGNTHAGNIIFADDGLFLQDQNNKNGLWVRGARAVALGGFAVRANHAGSDVFAVDGSGNTTIGGTLGIPTTAESDFTLVLMPDSQMEVEDYPAVWEAQYAWIVANKDAQNIRAVMHTGDITNTGGEDQFTEAAKGLAALNAANIPSIWTVGNHDYDGAGVQGKQTPWTRATTVFDAAFPTQPLKSWFGGAQTTGSQKNSWIKLTVGSHNIGLMALEFFPSNSTLAWASGVIAANPDYDFIILTHSYLNLDGTRTRTGNLYGLAATSVPTSAPNDTTANDSNGDWAGLSQLPNVLAIVSGHQYNDACSPRSAYTPALGTNGNVVHQLVFDHQCGPNGGDGYLGLMTFHPNQGTISFSSYGTNVGVGDPADSYTWSWHSVRAVSAVSTPLQVAANAISSSGDIVADGKLRAENGLNVRGGNVTIAAGENPIYLGGDPTTQFGNPSVWLGNSGSIFSGSSPYFLANAYWDKAVSGWKYQKTGAATQLALFGDGQMMLYSAPSGTAGGNVTFTNVFRCVATTHNCGVGTTAPAAKFDVEGTFRIKQHTPATSTEACVAGQIVADADYIYTCVATDSWHRVSNGAAW